MQAIAAAAMSGGADLLGTYMTNETNRGIANKQMDFQREMSNTAYQRSMADMKKAGLNPMLASSMGGASTPPGASYQAQNIGEGVAETINSAYQNSKIKTEMDLLKTNVDMNKSQIQTQKTVQALNSELARKAQADALVSQATAKNVNANTQMTGYSLEGAKNEADFQKGVGSLGKWLKFGLGTIKSAKDIYSRRGDPNYNSYYPTINVKK